METRCIQFVFSALLTVVLTACPKPILQQAPSEVEETVIEKQAAGESPRVAASLQLTEQGRRLVEDRQPDKAIRVLEQALSLYPDNGRSYYYLAEAWLIKGFAGQAKAFNLLAEIHLKDDDRWLIRVAKQADRIAELEK